MELLSKLLQNSLRPIPHHLLADYLSDYKRPNEKIHELLSKKILLPLARGLYLVNPDFSHQIADKILIANLLRGPSYVSLDYALARHGAIPERVDEITSVTTKTSKIIENAIGRFSYIHLPLPYYSFGIGSEKISGNQYALMATPEKALLDKVVCSPYLQLRSMKEAREYLTEDLRIDEHWLKQLRADRMERWLKNAHKINSLNNLLKVIRLL